MIAFRKEVSGKEIMMVRRAYLVALLSLALASWSAAAPIQEQAKPDRPAGKQLKVKISYTGKGTVDSKHGIFMFLFDSPDFVQSPGTVMPIAFKSCMANDETVIFEALAADTVYLVAAFDEAGGYEMQGPPPSGTPVSVYKPGDPQLPSPIKLDAAKETEIKFSFDESIRMP